MIGNELCAPNAAWIMLNVNKTMSQEAWWIEDLEVRRKEPARIVSTEQLKKNIVDCLDAKIPFIFSTNSEIRASMELFKEKPKREIRHELQEAVRRLHEAQQQVKLCRPFFDNVLQGNRESLLSFFEQLSTRPESELVLFEQFIEAVGVASRTGGRLKLSQLETLVWWIYIGHGYEKKALKTALHQASDLLLSHRADRLMDELDHPSDTV